MGFDDIEVTHDGERAFSFKFIRGDRVKDAGTFIIPVPIYRGLYEDGRQYEKGDVVTSNGGMFFAKVATSINPEHAPTPSPWQCCVMRGREGKQGKQGLPGVQGSRGEKGEPGTGHY